MKINILPLRIFGAADLETNEIFISNNLSKTNFINTLVHEIGHIIRGELCHDDKWFYICHSILPSFYYLNTFDWNVGNINVGNIIGNVGNVTGIQNILTDYHLLQAYRKFSQRVLATEGQWEVRGDNKIRLFPTPRGSYPVVVQYIPAVTRWHSPEAKEVTKRMLVAEAKIMLGNARSKFSGIPGPDGGQISMNGDSLRTEGMEEKKQALEDALLLSEPLGFVTW